MKQGKEIKIKLLSWYQKLISYNLLNIGFSQMMNWIKFGLGDFSDSYKNWVVIFWY